MTTVTSTKKASGRVATGSGGDSPTADIGSGSFSEFFELNEDALVVADRTGRVVAANPPAERLFGYLPSELDGCELSLLFTGGFDLSEVLTPSGPTARRLPVGGPAEGNFVPDCDREVTGVRKSGERVPMWLTVRPIAGSEEGMVLVAMRASKMDTADSAALVTEAAGRDMLALQRELLVEVARGHGVGGIATVLQARTGRKVLILDHVGYVVASAGYSEEDPAPPRLVDVLRGDTPHAVRQRLGDFWMAGARPDRVLLGSIAILDPAGDLPDSDQLALEQAISILSAELLQLNSVVEATSADWGAFAADLLDGHDAERLSLYAKVHGYDLDRAHRAVAVQAGGIGSESLPVIEQVVRNLGVQTPLVTGHSDRIILVAPTELSWGTVTAALTGALGVGTRIGVGGSYPVDELPRSLAEAVMALELGAMVHGDKSVTTFTDLGVWGILADSRHPDKLRDLVEGWIGTLIEVDKQHGSELVKTLTSYLKESLAVETTAASLHIHRNTLRYRLSKIAAITGHDLGDADQRFHLELACRAWTVLQILEAP